jgi:serine/threonine protein phosphatase 1
MKNYWVVGDIHGEIVLLERLLENIEKFNPEEVVFVGDYIDRGPASREVIAKIRELPYRTTCLLGNHELMLINAIEDLGIGYSPTELWYYNGGEATVQSFGFTNFYSFRSGLDPVSRDFFYGLAMARAIETGPGVKILVSHAGIAPLIAVEDQMKISNYNELIAYLLHHRIDVGDSFLWVRDSFFSADPSLWQGYFVVHGHTPVMKLKRFLQGRAAGGFHFIDHDLCIRKDPGTGAFVSLDVDSGSVISGRLSGAGFFEETGPSGGPVLRMRSLTVSREEIFPRDLGILSIVSS